jgi:hypothetical protein
MARNLRHINIMCEKCDSLGERIDRYRRLSETLADLPTKQHLVDLIGMLEAEKSALHPPPG